MDERKNIWERRRERIHQITEVGYTGDWISRGYDWLGVILVYGIYLLIHALPYLPFWLAYRKTAPKQQVPLG